MGLDKHIEAPEQKPEVQRVNWDLNGLLTRNDGSDLFDAPSKPANDRRTDSPVLISTGGMIADKGSAPILSNTASMYVSLSEQHKALGTLTNAISSTREFMSAKLDVPASEPTGWGKVSYSQPMDASTKLAPLTLNDASKADVNCKDDAGKGIGSSESLMQAPSRELQGYFELNALTKRDFIDKNNVSPVEKQEDSAKLEPTNLNLPKIESIEKNPAVNPEPSNTKSFDTPALNLNDALKSIQNKADFPSTLAEKGVNNPAVSPAANDKPLVDYKPAIETKPAIDQSIRKIDAPSLSAEAPKLSTDRNENRNTDSSFIKSLNIDCSPISRPLTDKINPILIVSSVAIVGGGPVAPVKPAESQPIKPAVSIIAPAPLARDVFIPAPSSVVAPRPVETRSTVNPIDSRVSLPQVDGPKLPGGQPPRAVSPQGEQVPNRDFIPNIGADQTAKMLANNVSKSGAAEDTNIRKPQSEDLQGRQLTVVGMASIALGGNDFKNNLRDFTKEAATLAQIYTRSPQAITGLIISAQRELSSKNSGAAVPATVDVSNAKNVATIIKNGDLPQSNRRVLEPVNPPFAGQNSKTLNLLDQVKVKPAVEEIGGRTAEQKVAQAVPANTRLVGPIVDRPLSVAQAALSFVKDRVQSASNSDLTTSRPGASVAGRPLFNGERAEGQWQPLGPGTLGGFESSRNAGSKYDGAYAAFLQPHKSQAAFDVNSKTGMGLRAVQQSWNAAIAAGAAHAVDNARLIEGETDSIRKHAQHITRRMEESIRRVSDSAFANRASEMHAHQNRKSEAAELMERKQQIAEGADQLAGESGGNDSGSSPVHTQAFIIALLLSIGGLSRGRFANADLLESGISASLNDEEQSTRPLANNRRRKTHMVEAKDTLQSIAEKYYGDSRVAWLIADLNSPIEHNVEEGRVVELKTRQLLELPEVLEAKAFLRSLTREFDVNKLTTIVTDTMINLEVLQNFLGAINLTEDNSFRTTEFVLPALTICAE